MKLLAAIFLTTLMSVAAEARVALTSDYNLTYDCSTTLGTRPDIAYATMQEAIDLNGYREIVTVSGTCSGINWNFTGPLPPGNLGYGSFVISGGTLSGHLSIGKGAAVTLDNQTHVPPNGGNFADVMDSTVQLTGTIYTQTAPASEYMHLVGHSSFVQNASVWLSAASGTMTMVLNAEDSGANVYTSGPWYFNGYPAFGVFSQADYNGVVDESGMTCTGGYSGAASRGVAGGQVLTAPGCP